ncbi:MAG TPA: hypothetical protein VMF57_01285 [Solirubrobacteraceae bacterium]|nr:hypothetical protein [Solirubrobacteraceae bacterium]
MRFEQRVELRCVCYGRHGVGGIDVDQRRPSGWCGDQSWLHLQL